MPGPPLPGPGATSTTAAASTATAAGRRAFSMSSPPSGVVGSNCRGNVTPLSVVTYGEQVRALVVGDVRVGGAVGDRVFEPGFPARERRLAGAGVRPVDDDRAVGREDHV